MNSAQRRLKSRAYDRLHSDKKRKQGKQNLLAFMKSVDPSTLFVVEKPTMWEKFVKFVKRLF